MCGSPSRLLTHSVLPSLLNSAFSWKYRLMCITHNHLMLANMPCLSFKTLKMHSFHQPETTCLFFSLTSFIPCLFAGGCWLAVSGDSPICHPCMVCPCTVCTAFQETCRRCLLVAWEVEALLRHGWILVVSAALCEVPLNPPSSGSDISVLYLKITERTNMDWQAGMAGENTGFYLRIISTVITSTSECTVCF